MTTSQTADQIIEKFELQVDDQSELSTTESFALLNKVLRKVYTMHSWAWLMKSASASVSNKEADLPSDYYYILESYDDNTGTPREMVHVTSNNSSYSRVIVIPQNARRNYSDNQSICWIDLVNDKIKFQTSDYDGQTVEFDYQHLPANVSTGEYPVGPKNLQDALPHLMAAEFDFQQQVEKGLSYAGENLQMYRDYLSDMIYQNDIHLTYGQRV